MTLLKLKMFREYTPGKWRCGLLSDLRKNQPYRRMTSVGLASELPVTLCCPPDAESSPEPIACTLTH
jgi:hypothetical protein